MEKKNSHIKISVIWKIDKWKILNCPFKTILLLQYYIPTYAPTRYNNNIITLFIQYCLPIQRHYNIILNYLVLVLVQYNKIII